jgi:hypothetical protein
VIELIPHLGVFMTAEVQVSWTITLPRHIDITRECQRELEPGTLKQKVHHENSPLGKTINMYLSERWLLRNSWMTADMSLQARTAVFAYICSYGKEALCGLALLGTMLDRWQQIQANIQHNPAKKPSAA